MSSMCSLLDCLLLEVKEHLERRDINRGDFWIGEEKKGTLSKIPEVRLLSEVLEHLRVTWRQAGHHSCPSNPPRAGGQMRASTRAVAAPPHPWAPGVADPEPGLQGALVCTMSL